MKIYDSQMAPNPRRVRIFLAEKGIDVPYEQVNLGSAENRQPAFLEKNPLGTVPVLEFDDRETMNESVAICRYFEEVQPEPSLFGRDAREKARVEMWNRRMENEILVPIAGVFRNTHDFFKGRIPQVPEYGEVCRESASKRMEWLNQVLADREFVAGDSISVADITAYVGIDFGRVSRIRVQPEQKNLSRWYEAMGSRPSAKA